MGDSETPATVTVRLLPVADGAAVAGECAGRLLDPREAARAARYQDPAARLLYTTAHVGLRLLLAELTGTAPEALRFAREPCPVPGCGGQHGRPVLAGAPGPHFSLSHGGDFVLYGFADRPLGVDIEPERTAAPGGHASRLHPAERRALTALAPARRAAALTGCLVRKEAYGKGLGTGLAGGVMARRVGLADADQQPPAPHPPGWTLTDLPVPPGYRAALAVSLPDPAPEDVRERRPGGAVGDVPAAAQGGTGRHGSHGRAGQGLGEVVGRTAPDPPGAPGQDPGAGRADTGRAVRTTGAAGLRPDLRRVRLRRGDGGPATVTADWTTPR